MNPRIRELAEQAGYQEDMFGLGHWDMPECQRFVELIVRECADYAFSDEQDHRAMLKHFGVES